VIVPDKLFQPSPIFVGTAGAYLNKEAFRCSIQG